MNLAQQRFFFVERFLKFVIGRHAIRDVAQNNGEQGAALRVDAGDGSFGGEFGSVFAPALDLTAFAHGAGCDAGACKIRHLLTMSSRRVLG